MIREGVPFPSPSSAPQEVIDKVDTRKPALMILRARLPAWMVWGFSVNSPISCPGISRQIIVPRIMIQLSIARVVR